MKAFVVTAPMTSVVMDVVDPIPDAGQVVVKVARAGVCGTDFEFFDGTMAYFQTGEAEYPLRLGHEWCGTVIGAGDDDSKKWVGRRVTGDTMLGCGTCYRCTSGRHYLCADRYEIGIRNGFHGALAEEVLVPTSALLELPDSIDDALGALIEPAGNSYRAAKAAGAGPGKCILIYGTGTIGLLAAQFSLAMGAEVHMVGTDPKTIALAKTLGVHHAGTTFQEVENGFDAVIDATDHHDIPATALEVVEYGGTIVFIGLSRKPSLIDTRRMALKDVKAIGLLSASLGLPGAIKAFATGEIDPRPLIGATVGLAEVGKVLAGIRPEHAGAGPKIHVNPGVLHA